MTPKYESEQENGDEYGVFLECILKQLSFPKVEAKLPNNDVLHAVFAISGCKKTTRDVDFTCLTSSFLLNLCSVMVGPLFVVVSLIRPNDDALSIFVCRPLWYL